MQIKVPDSWLKDHLETKAGPEKIAQALTLAGPTVDKLKRENGDWVYLIEVTSNRPDLLSVRGIAREAAASLPRFGHRAKMRETGQEKLPEKGEIKLDLKVAADDLGRRFAAIVLDNIHLKPSPTFIKKRLELSGVRSLNNVVDISNYLMLELGQPVHAFDYDKVAGAKMVMRLSQKGEKVVTLDGEERILPADVIVIEDGGGKLIDLCGLMGGKNSAIEEATKRVILFVQTYEAVKIRRASQALNLRTEASARFEKGLDPELVGPTLVKGVRLLEELAEARVVSGLIDIYPQPYQAAEIKLDVGFARDLIGQEIKASEMAAILTSLGFSVKTKSSELKVTIPSWRAGDVTIPEDLIEEITRIYGYHHLPSRLPTGELPEEEPNPIFFWEEKVKRKLSDWGFSEIVSYSLISRDLVQKCLFDPRSFLELENPLTEELTLLRRSLIPSLLSTISQNQDKEAILQLFELGHIYLPKGQGNLPEERPILALAATGQTFRQLKGVVETLLEGLKVRYSFARTKEKSSRWHPNRTAVVNIDFDGQSHQLGTIGEVAPQILSNLEIKKRVILSVLDFSEMVDHASVIAAYKPLPKYPPITQDVAFILPERAEVGPLMEEIKATDKLVVSVSLFDIHQDSRTFRLTFQHPERNLTDREVGQIREKIVKSVQKKFGARVK